MIALRYLRATALVFAVVAASVDAAPVLYHTYKATISVTVVSREQNATGQNVLITRKLTNKQIANLAQGRTLDAAAPKNEVIVALLPEDYLNPTALRIVLMDTNTSTVLKVLVITDSAVVAYGPPDGYFAQAIGTGTLLALNGAGFIVAQTPLNVSIKGFEKPIANGYLISIQTVSISGGTTLTINGTPVPAIITGGNVRVTGKNLLDLYADL